MLQIAGDSSVRGSTGSPRTDLIGASLAGLIGTVAIARRMLVTEVGALIAASALLWLACLGGAVTRLEGGLLVLTYLGYLYYLGRTRNNVRPRARSPLPRLRAPLLVLLISACFIAMGLLADPVLAAAQRLVALLSLSASLFGVLVLGICAALPEFMTALVSILKGQRDISAGILIGSNITNPLFGAGLGALISGYTVPAVIVVYDLPVKIATGALLFIFLWHNENLSRYAALILLAFYFGYVLLLPCFFPGDF